MAVADDAFIRFLAELYGRTVVVAPGQGGVEDAVTGLALHQLCASNGITCLPFGDGGGEEPILIGSAMAARAVLRGAANTGRAAFLPGSLSSFEEVGLAVNTDALLFCRDEVALRRAELMGVDPGRVRLCDDLSMALDVEAAMPPAGLGTLTLAGHPVSGQDRIELRLDGRDGRWGSPERCRDAVAALTSLIAPYGRVRTDNPALAIVAGKLNKSVILGRGAEGSGNASVFARTISPAFPSVTLDGDPDTSAGAPAFPSVTLDGDPEIGAGGPADVAAGPAGVMATLEGEVARLRTGIATARRDAELAVQARDREQVRATLLQDRLDACAVAAIRQADEGLAEARRSAALADAHRSAALAAEALQRDADARLTAAERARREASERDVASAARQVELEGEAAELKEAVQVRLHQALALQAALDDSEARRRIADARVDQVRHLLESRTAAADAAMRDAASARRKLQEVLSSSSWRASRPLRGVARSLRRLRGSDGEKHGG